MKAYDIELLLSCAGGGFDYWCQIDFETDDYRKAKAEMVEKKILPEFGSKFCVEQVVAYMITNGYKVYINDVEDEKKYLITPEMLGKGFELNAKNHPEDASLEDGDANTADRILQYAVFGEVVYS